MFISWVKFLELGKTLEIVAWMSFFKKDKKHIQYFPNIYLNR